MKPERRWRPFWRGNPKAAGGYFCSRFSLRTRLTAALLLVAWIPLLITLALQYRVIDLNLSEHAGRELLKLSEVQQRRIDRELARYATDLALIASRTQLRITLDAFNEHGDPEDQAFLEQILHDAVASRPHLKGVWVYDLDGGPAAAAGAQDSWPTENLFSRLPTHNGIRFGPHWSAPDCDRMIWLGSELELNDRPVGHLLLSVGVAGLVELLDDFPDPAVIGQSYAVLTSGDGSLCVLAGAGPDHGVYRHFIAGSEELGAFLESNPLGTSEHTHAKHQGAHWMLLPLSHEFGHLVVHAAPRLQSDLRRVVLAGFGLVALVVLAMAALFSVWVARRIGRPVYQLVDAVAAVRDGKRIPKFQDHAWPREFRNLHDELIRTLKSQHRFVSALRREVRQRRQAQRQLLDLANTDELTSLANRRYLVQRLADHINGTPAPGVLLYMDLDRFKPVNDEHGHPVGDEVLKAVAERLLHTLRDQDVPARMGGDEFAVLLIDDEHADNAQGVADRIERAISQPITVGDITVTVGCSIGMVELHAGMSIRDALQQADDAMYQVKASRGRRY